VRALVAALVLTLALGASSSTDPSAGEAAGLARSAATDPEALDDLRAAATVEGRRVDLATAVDRGDPVAAAAALGGLGISRVDREEVDRVVAEILEAPKYERRAEGRLDRLLRRVSTWMVSALVRLVGWLGGNLAATVIATLLLVTAVAAITFGLGRRRVRESERRTAIERILAMGPDPSELERQARQASEDGDHGPAVRLRFVAGLLRLDETGRIRFRPGLSTHRIQAAMADPDFDGLVRTFEEIAYGGRRATAADDQESREGWDRLLGRVMA
jgi:hypothetical protein